MSLNFLVVGYFGSWVACVKISRMDLSDLSHFSLVSNFQLRELPPQLWYWQFDNINSQIDDINLVQFLM